MMFDSEGFVAILESAFEPESLIVISDVTSQLILYFEDCSANLAYELIILIMNGLNMFVEIVIGFKYHRAKRTLHCITFVEVISLMALYLLFRFKFDFTIRFVADEDLFLVGSFKDLNSHVVYGCGAMSFFLILILPCFQMIRQENYLWCCFLIFKFF